MLGAMHAPSALHPLRLATTQPRISPPNFLFAPPAWPVSQQCPIPGVDTSPAGWWVPVTSPVVVYPLSLAHALGARQCQSSVRCTGVSAILKSWGGTFHSLRRVLMRAAVPATARMKCCTALSAKAATVPF